MLPEPLQSFVFVRNNLREVKASASMCQGTVELSPIMIEVLNNLAKADVVEPSGDLQGKTIFFDQLRSDTAGSLKITLAPYKLRACGSTYFESIDEMVAEYQAAAPSQSYYIHDLRFFAGAGNVKPEQIECYEMVIALAAFLKSISDVVVTEGRDAILHFFAKTQLEVPIIYSKSDFREIPTALAFFSKFRQVETRDQQVQILKAVLEEQLRAEQKNMRFRYLLKKWEGIVESFEHSYKLYLLNFSWEKLRGEIEKEKFELKRKIAATIGEIQTKLVAIPAAFAFTAVQLLDVDSWLKILLTLGATVVFSALFETLLVNQRIYLDSVKEECLAIQNRLSRDYALIAQTSPEWNPINTAIARQRAALNWISVCNWSIPASVVFYIIIFVFVPKILTS